MNARTNITVIKVGDKVELLPTNQRNRQLRKQQGKHEWTVLKINPSAQCFNGKEAIAIESLIDSSHWRWVERTDIKLIEFKENLRFSS